MKRKIKKVFPLFFSFFTLIIDFIVFRPDLGSISMTTSFLAFSTALSWSSVIIYCQDRSLNIMKIYLAAAIVYPALAMGPLEIWPTDLYWHWVIYAMMNISIAGLYVFIHLYLNKRENSFQ